MGLFGNLFDKKECSVCGGEIGLLGNRKLEDGNLCKNCAKKLSPWFSDRRKSTVDEIKQQLAYREENRGKCAQFRPTRVMGERCKVLIDESHGWIAVSRTDNIVDENPDIIDFSQLTGCRLDVDEHRNEIMRKDSQGNSMSYNPPRYEYSYDYHIIISVSTPYFSEMRFQLNPYTVKGGVQQNQMQMRGGFGGSIMNGIGMGLSNAMGMNMGGPMSQEMMQYQQMGNDICNALNQIMNNRQMAGTQQPEQPTFAQEPKMQAPTGPWSCPQCGAQNSGRFCEFCGAARA